MRNAFEGAQEDTYVLDPAEQLAVEKEARAQGWSVVGIFHLIRLRRLLLETRSGKLVSVVFVRGAFDQERRV